MKLIFDKKLSLLLIPGFILFTAIGTVSHEGGHYFAAKYFGYDASINYAYASWEDPKTEPFLDSTYSKFKIQITGGKDFPEKEKYSQIMNTQGKDNFWIIFGGPIQTMLTGTVGFILLFVFRKKYYAADKLRFKQWLLIFSSLFWLRQVANFVTWLGGYFIKGKVFGHGDESGIAYHLGFPNWGIAFLTAFIGAIVLAIVVFKFIPLKQRFTFIVSGLIGGISGYILWLKLLGPILMP